MHTRTFGLIAAVLSVSASAATFPTSWQPVAINDSDGGVINLGDPINDGSNNGRNIVGDNARPAFYTASNATDFFFRMRLDTDPSGPGGLGSYGWGILIDADGDIRDYDYALMINGTGEAVDYSKKTTKTLAGDPTELADTLLSSVPTVYSGASQNVRLTAVGVGTGGFSSNEDYFLDVAIPLSTFYGTNPDGGAYLNFSPSTVIRFWVGVSNSSRQIQVDLGGTGTSPGPGTLAGTVSVPQLLCQADSACGSTTSGKICSSGTCVDGCRGSGGNGCPVSATCSSVDSTPGVCVASGVPTLTSPANGSITNDTTPTLTGTAAAGATVTVFIDGASVGTTTADGSGNWSFTSAALSQASHSAYVTSPGGTSNTNSFTVDSVAPAAPVVVTPANGSVTNDNTPTYAGTAEANSTVAIVVDGFLAGTATADGSGNWSFTPVSTLSNGSHTVVAAATDAAGNTSINSNTNTFTVDTTAPAAPVVTAPANGSTTNDNTPTVTGTAEANSTVAVFVDGVQVGTTTASGAGAWSFTTSTLADGSHTVRATATDAAGNTSANSNTNTFTVDTAAPAAPVVTAPSNGSTTNDNTPTVTGTAEANATVAVFVDGVQVGTTTASGAGAWSFTTSTLADGSHTVRATATDAAGNTSANSNTNTFTVDTAAPAAPVVTAPANGSTTNDSTPTYTGTAEPNSLVAISVDGFLVGTATTNASGQWSFTPTSPLSDGSHTVRAAATDAGGSTSIDSAPSTFIVDTRAPAAPVVTAPADGSTTGDNTPTVTGTAEPNATVSIFIDGVQVGTVTANGSGAWTFTTSALTDGAHTVRATATDAAGNASQTSSTSTFTVDTGAPTAPVVTAPADQSTTTDTTPTITGTSEPNATITIVIDGQQVGTTTANASGAWTFTASTLTLGQHTVSARATDSSGNSSPTSTANTFTVLPFPPAVPTLSSPSDGSIGSDTTPTFSGTAEPGSTVTVRVDGEIVCTATATASGDFSCTPTVALREGAHVVTASAANAGGSSAESTANRFIIDATAPLTPVVVGPANQSTTTDTTPAIVGTGEPGSTIDVRIDGASVGSTTVAADGTWSFTPAALSLGAHTVSARATDVAGNPSLPSNTNTFTVVAPSAARPTLDQPADNSALDTAQPTFSGTAPAGAMVTVRVDGVPVCTATATMAGTWTCSPATPLAEGPHRATAETSDGQGGALTSNTNSFSVDTRAPAAPVVTRPANGSVTDDTTPELGGTAEPLTTVAVFVDGLQLGTAAVDVDGRWSLTPSSPLALGMHTVTATSTDRAGNTSSTSTAASFTIVAPGSTPFVLAPAPGSSTSDATPLISGTATPGATVEALVDGVVVCTAVATNSGAWSCAPTTPLTEGRHDVTAREQGATTTSPAVPFVVDTIAPATPTISSPQPNAHTGALPTLSGTAEPGARVEVKVDGAPVCVTLADATGAWSCVPPTPLSMGAHTVSATATDVAGNTSMPAGPVPFTVDETPPDAPAITAPAAGSSTTDTTPTFSGTAEPGSIVTVRVDGMVACVTTATSSGTFSCDATAELPRGTHEVTATATDAGGNTSTASTAVSFSVIPVTPPAPAITGPAEGTLVSMSSVVISGTAQPGTTVTVREGSTVVCTATVSASGAWSCTAASLTDGPHQFTATASDDGVESQPSPPRTIAVDTTPPVVDVTGAPVVPTNETTTTVQWQTEPGTTYQCSIDGGAFTDCTSPTTLNGLAPGEHSITVRATDEAGNVTETTTTWLVEEPARWSLAGTGISCTSAPLGSLAPLALILVLRRRKRQG